MRVGGPIWLARSTRFAQLSPAMARRVLGVVALLLLATLLALRSPEAPSVGHSATANGQEQTDIFLYETIVDGVRHGGDYYTVTAEALRRGNYPLRPFVTFRLPTLAMIQAALPQPAVVALLDVLAAAVMVAWYARLSPVFAQTPVFAQATSRVVALVLLTGGMIAFVQPALIAFHEIWAGLLIALSLALRRPGRWVEAVALGLAAMLIRETAALYVAVMAAMAFLDGERREAIGWTVAVAVLAITVILHAAAVASVVHPLDLHSPGWTGLLGPGFFVRTMAVSTVLALIPLWLAAPLVGLSLVGWAAWRDPLALRALATFAIYAVLLSLFGRADTFYWGLLVAPTLLVGLAFVPDALHDLFALARDTRRITVKRVLR